MARNFHPFYVVSRLSQLLLWLGQTNKLGAVVGMSFDKPLRLFFPRQIFFFFSDPFTPCLGASCTHHRGI